MILELRGVAKRFGGLTAIADASVSVPAGGITGLIGPNGAGKTTLFGIVSGFVEASAGRVLFDGLDVTAEPPHRRARLGIARTFQIVQPFAGLTVRENVAVGAYLRHPKRRQALERADAAGRRVGLGPLLDRPAAALTVSGRKRLEVARAIATEPRLLLLDEVLAGLNPSEIRDILPVLRDIAAGGVTVVMIEHVMQAVMSLCERVSVLAGGRIIAEGPPREVCADPRVVEAYLGRDAAARLGEAADA